MSGVALDAQSPRRRALARFTRNRSALGGLIALVVLALFCAIGPALSPHPYDRVYRDYIKTPPTFSAHPSVKEQAAALDRIAARLNADVTIVASSPDVVRATLQAPKAIDETLLLDAFAGSNIFAGATVRR